MLIMDFDFAEQGVRNGLPDALLLARGVRSRRHAGLALHRDAAPHRDPASLSGSPALERAALHREGPSSSHAPSACPVTGPRPCSCQPETVGPARSISKRTRTRCSRTSSRRGSRPSRRARRRSAGSSRPAGRAPRAARRSRRCPRPGPIAVEPGVETHSETRGSRRRFFTFTAGSRVEISTRPCSSTPTRHRGRAAAGRRGGTSPAPPRGWRG